MRDDVPGAIRRLSQAITRLAVLVQVGRVALIRLAQGLLRNLLARPDLSKASPPAKIGGTRECLHLPVRLLNGRVDRDEREEDDFFDRQRPIHSQRVIFESVRVVTWEGLRVPCRQVLVPYCFLNGFVDRPSNNRFRIELSKTGPSVAR